MSEEQRFELITMAEGDYPLDIVVLTHNAKDTTEEFLHLLYSKTDAKKFHLVLVDNASSDDSVELLANHALRHSNTTLFLCEKNLGVIGGRNFGYFHGSEHTEAKLVMFLDNDQFVCDGWLEQHLAVMGMGYDLVGVEAWRMNKNYFPARKIASCREQFSYVGCGGMVVRKAVIENIGLFDDIFNPAYFEDPDFCVRARLAGYQIGWNYKAKIIHLGHKTLGQVDQKEKQNRFMSSWEKFRKKWRNEKMPQLLQVDLDLVFGEKKP